MIEGRVNSELEATIPLQIRGTDGRTLCIEAVIDTGFSAQLSLPIESIKELGLSWRKRESATLADGSEIRVNVYRAEVIWDGGPRVVEVISTEVQPLVGMSLLGGHALNVDVVENGIVRIEALSTDVASQ